MKSQISEYVATCDICQKRKAFTNKKAPLQSLSLVNRLWERIACDLVGPIKTINQKCEYRMLTAMLSFVFLFVLSEERKTQANRLRRCSINERGTKKTGKNRHL